MSTEKMNKVDQNLTKDDVISLYTSMLTLRLFEEKAASLYTQGKIFGFCHLYIGQEAVVAGINFVLGDKDTQVTGYRDHAHMITCGADPKNVMAELCGKSTGCSKGKGGSMHMYARENRFFGGHGIVGSQVSIGTGLAFSHKYKGDNGIAVVYFGDGAANQGQVYESFNMASLWKLPALYVLENNHYAMGTSQQRAVAGNNLEQRGAPFGIPCYSSDGMDLFDVIEKTKQALEYIQAGNGPAILHVDTYRYRGHSMSDPATYRTREEVDNIKNTRDPIEQVKNFLKEKYSVSESEFDNIEDSVSDTIDAASEFAVSSDSPNEEDLFNDCLV